MDARRGLCAIAGLLCLGSACSRVGSTTGQLYGTDPGPWVSGFWWTTDKGYQNRIFVQATMVDYRNACQDHVSLLADYLAAAELYKGGTVDLDGLALALEEADKQWLPDKRWVFDFEIQPSNLDSVPDTYPTGPEFGLSVWEIWQQTNWYDELGLLESGSSEPTCFASVEGEARVLAFADGADFVAEGEVAMVDCYQQADAGAIGFEFTLPTCQGFSELQDAWQDQLSDILGG